MLISVSFSNLKDEEDILDSTDHGREDSNNILKKNAELINKIKYLKKQLLVYSNVHEQNAELRKEVEELRKENLHLRSAHSAALCFEERLQRLVIDDSLHTNTEEQTTGNCKQKKQPTMRD